MFNPTWRLRANGFAWLTLAWLYSAAAFSEENLNKPTIKPQLAVPLLTKVPAIDGAIGDGEWPTAHVSRFVSQGGADLLMDAPGEFWIGRDATHLYLAVRSGVHPTAGAVTKLTEVIPGKDVRDTVFDDSIEIWFHNAPTGGAGEYFQIMVNSAGVMFDQMYDATEKIGQTFWRADMRQAHRVEQGIWTAEFAISLDSLRVKDVAKPMAMRVCRNYKNPWNQARWGAGVHAFDTPETMPQLRFVDSSPVINELGFQDEQGIRVAVELTNTTAQPLATNVKLGYNAESQPRYFSETPAQLAPGEKRVFEYRKEFFTPDNYPALAEILVTDNQGAVLCHRDVKWNTKPQNPFWAPMGALAADEGVRFKFEFFPSWKTVRWTTDFANLKGREDVKQVRLVITPRNGGAVVHESKQPANEQFVIPIQQEQLATLPDGIYQAAVYLDAASPATAPVKSALFEMKSDYPWLNNNIGKADIVIPPFTPMQVNGNRISTVLREHELDATGLWSQVVADGKPILAQPMRIEVDRGGKTASADGTVKVTSQKPTLVTAQADWQAPGMAGQTLVSMEYDGCAKVTLKLTPTDKEPIDAVRLVIPLHNTAAPLMHAVGDGIRFNYAGKVPDGQGKVWSSDKASRNDFLGTFLPYVWVGGESRGLCWFAGNDRDWGIDPIGKAPSLELHRDGEVLKLVVNLVQVPTALERERTIVFGLQATPTRPMPSNPNWRMIGVASHAPVDYKVLGMCTYWGGMFYTVAPRGNDYAIVQKITAAATKADRDDAFFKSYTEKNADIAAEVNWAAQAGNAAGVIPYTNLRGGNTHLPEWFVYQDEWRNSVFSERVPEPGNGGPIDFIVSLPPSQVDYLLYHYQKFIENGFTAIYWDNIYIEANKSSVASAAFEHPLGGIQPEGDIWQVREITKRTAVMLHQMGKPNVTVPHTTNAFLVPAFSWTGFNLDWEWKYGASDFQDRFGKDYTRACTIGRQAGSVPIILDGISGTKTAEEQAWVERTQVAVCLPHEIKVWNARELIFRLYNSMIELGYGTDAATVHHYWDEQPVAKVEGLDTAWIVLNGKDAVMVVIGDYGNGGNGRLTLDVQRLGLPANFTVANWEKPDEVTAAAGGVIALDNFRKHDFRALLIKKVGN